MDFLKKKIYLFVELNKKAGRRGVVIYLMAMIMTVILTINFGISAILMMQVKSLSETGSSVIAFAAAETGIEWALRGINETNYTDMCDYDAASGKNICGGANQPVVEGSLANYTVNAYLCGTSLESLCVESIGEYRGAERSLKVQR